MTVTEMLARVLQDFAEASVNNDRVNLTEVLPILNDRYTDICRRTRCLSREASITVTSGTVLQGMPVDACAVKRGAVSGQLFDLRVTDVRTLGALVPNWRSMPHGTPQYIGMWDSLRYFLYPAPASAMTITLDVAIVPQATPPTGGVALLTIGANVPAFPEEFHYLLVEGAKATLGLGLLADSEPARTIGATALKGYDEGVAAMAALFT